MNIRKKVLKEALKGKGPCKNVKAGGRRYYQWQDTKDDSSDPLSDTISLMDHSANNIILDHICESQGGVFVKYEEGCETSKNVMTDTANMLDKISKVWTTCAKSLEDGVIDDMEGVEIEEAARDAMQIITAYLDNIKAHRYR